MALTEDQISETMPRPATAVLQSAMEPVTLGNLPQAMQAAYGAANLDGEEEDSERWDGQS